MPDHLSSIAHVYGEFVHRPYFVIVRSHPRPGHERFDQYNSAGLTELMLSVVEHLTAGSPEYLECMCELDAADKARIPGRTRRYVSKRREELYAEDSQGLLPASVEYKGYWFNTNAKHTQTRQIIQLVCRACNVPYSSVRKLKGFTGDA
ncbi:MAG TPA: hypothetical protein VM532_19130 [Burkholderiales bacterium]|jgi:hypothetical protein|nr:hypothetical protein [Burkholderiales bacterium]